MPFGQIGAWPRRDGAERLGVAAFVALGLFVGSAATSAGAVTLSLYSAQHEQTVDLLTKAFTKETGIDVKVHSGEGPASAGDAGQPAPRGPRGEPRVGRRPRAGECPRLQQGHDQGRGAALLAPRLR